MKIFFYLVIFSSFGCHSGKYFLQKNSLIQLEDAFYEVTPPAIKEGNSFAKITLIISNTEDLKEIEFIGVYFKNQFATLVFKANNTFEASIILPKKDALNEEKIPFTIQSNEIIISYKEKKKEKFALFKIKMKNTLDSNLIPR